MTVLILFLYLLVCDRLSVEEQQVIKKYIDILNDIYTVGLCFFLLKKNAESVYVKYFVN